MKKIEVWYLWEGEHVENTGGGLEWVRIENKRSEIWAKIIKLIYQNLQWLKKSFDLKFWMNF